MSDVDATSGRTLEELAGYLGFTEADLGRLRAAAPLLEPHLVAMAEAFYAAIEAQPRAGAVLREGPRQVDQLKRSLVRWARDLLTEKRDAAYGEARRRIGVKHAELALDQRWVLSAIGVVRGFLKGRLRTLLAEPDLTPALDALDRALDLDAALLTASYATSREARMMEGRDAEDRAVRKVQSLLLQGHHHAVNLGDVRAVLERLVPVDALAIVLDRPARGLLEIQAAAMETPIPALARGSVFPYAAVPGADVLSTGLAQQFPLDSVPDSPLRSDLAGAGLTQVTALPLWIDDRVIGLLCLASARSDAWTVRRREFLLSIADAVALAVARHEASLKLFDSEEQFRSLFEAVADGLFVLDSSGEFRVFNQAFVQLVNPGSGAEHDSDDVLPPEAARRVRSLFDEVVSSGQRRQAEVGLERDGRLRWLSIGLAPVHGHGGEVVAATGEVRDTTAERERTAQQAHQHKMTSLGLLAAGIAHEVSNPLASIACIAQDLEEMSADAESKDLLRKIVISTQRASGSLQKVLRFVRPPSRTAAPALQLREVIEQTLDMASFDPRARGITFALDVPDELPGARASADDVSQVLLNLLLNAMDALTITLGPPSERPPAPRLAPVDAGRLPDVILRARAADGAVAIDVEDRGPGIALEDQQRIFEPFYTTKAAGRGTGLGLFVSSQLIRDCGGRLTVRSRPGEGACFTVRLPRA